MARKRGGRYSAIISGRRGAASNGAIQKIAAYWQTGIKHDPSTNIGKGKARAASQALTIRPFGFGADDTEANNPYPMQFFVAARAAKPTVDTYKEKTLAGSLKIGNTFHTTKGNGNIIIPSTDLIIPARAIIVSGRAAKATPKTSKITGLKYGSYGGTSTSFPFGVAATGDTYHTIPKIEGVIQTEQDVFDLIKTAALAVESGVPPVVTLKAEYFATT